MRVGKPANAKSAYNYFTSLMHEEFRAEHPGKTVDFIDFQKRCAAKWKSLSAIEKAPFDKIAALDKLRFQEEIKIFPAPATGKEKKKKKIKDPNQPKKPLSAFFLFSNEKRAAVKADHPDASIGDVGKKLGEMWRVLGDVDKRTYEEAAKRAKDRFAREMEAFKEGRSLEAEDEVDEGDDGKGAEMEAKPMVDFGQLDAFLDVTIDMDETMAVLTTANDVEKAEVGTKDLDELSPDDGKGVDDGVVSSEERPEKDESPLAAISSEERLEEVSGALGAEEKAEPSAPTSMADGAIFEVGDTTEEFSTEPTATKKFDNCSEDIANPSVENATDNAAAEACGAAEVASERVDDSVIEDDDFDVYGELDALL